MVYTRLRVTLVAGLRCVPFFLHVVLLGVIYRSYVETVYQPTTYCETANVRGSIALLILEVYHRVHSNNYAAVHTYRQPFCILHEIT